MLDTPETAALRVRKHRMEQRLFSQGIHQYQITYLPYLDFSPESFQTPYAVGCRLIILDVLSAAVHELDSRPEFIAWLKMEGLWSHVSEQEKAFLYNQSPGDADMAELSWHIEGALALGWAMKLAETLPEATRPATEEEMEAFLSRIPEFGSPTSAFLQNLQFRPLEEIIDENLFHEIATSYFRDLLFNGHPDETSIHRTVSYERHKTLNWVRQYSGISDWDETDTST